MTTRSAVTNRSILVAARLEETLSSFIHGRKLAYLRSLMEFAVASEPGVERWVATKLTPMDTIIGETDWELTSSATVDAWNNTAITAEVNPEHTYVSIYGVRMSHPAAVLGTTAPVSGFRFAVGGSTIIEWSLWDLLQDRTDGGAAARTTETVNHGLMGLALTPMEIGPTKSLTIQERTVTASLAYVAEFLGYVVEPEGLRLRP